MEVTLMFVHDESSAVRLALGSGDTLHDAIDAATLSQDTAAFEGCSLAAIFPGKLSHEGVREWVEILNGIT